MAVADDVVFVDPWWDLRTGGDDERRHAESLLDEIRAEVTSGHPLYGVDAEVIASCSARDDVLVRLADGRFALVHVTYGGAEVPPWPSTTFFESAGEIEAEMRRRDG